MGVLSANSVRNDMVLERLRCSSPTAIEVPSRLRLMILILGTVERLSCKTLVSCSLF